MSAGFATLGGSSVIEHTKEVERKIRANPRDAGQRLALCHLLAVRGDWQRAEDQLKRAAEIDAAFSPVSAACSMALVGERHRSEFWGGGRAPILLLEAEEWIEQLIAAAALPLALADEAAALRESARQSAPAIHGTLCCAGHLDAHTVQTPYGENVEQHDFAWLCDGDARIGAVLELFTPAGYGWLPLSQVQRIRFSRPRHLVDLLWAPAEIKLRKSRSLNGLVPILYPGKLDGLDDMSALGHRTEWRQLNGEDQYAGIGQRTLISDSGDHSLRDIRLIEFATDSEAAL